MKIVKLQLLILFLTLSLNSCNKSTHEGFKHTYLVEEICVDTRYGELPKTEYEIKFYEKKKSLFFDLPIRNVYGIEVFINCDETFSFTAYDQTIDISGYGGFGIDNSLYMHYKCNNHDFMADCKCNGKRIQ